MDDDDSDDAKIATLKAKRQQAEEQSKEKSLKHIKEERKGILLELDGAPNLKFGVILERSSVSEETKKWFIDRGFIFEPVWHPDYYSKEPRLKLRLK